MVLSINPSGRLLALTVGLAVVRTVSQLQYLYPAICRGRLREGQYLVPVVTSCLQFYSCAPGHVARIMKCSKGTLFDAKLRMCVSESAVDCGDRSRPPGSSVVYSLPRPSLRTGSALKTTSDARYQLSMSQPFTAKGFDVTSCQRLKAALDRAALNDPVMAACSDVNGGECSFPEFSCQPADSLLTTLPPGSASPLLNLVSYQRVQ